MAASPPSLASNAGGARELRICEAWGAHSLSFVGLMPDKSVFLAPDERGLIGYVDTAGVALALGDPVAPPSEVGKTAAAFRAAAAHRGHAAAFYASTDRARAALEEAGFSSVVFGSEPVLELRTFDLAGGHRKSLRGAYHHGQREGIHVEELRADAPRPAWERAIREIERRWLDRHGGTTLQAFTDVPTVGSFEATGPRRFVALQGGRLLAVSVVLPVPARRGFAMHVVRRDPDAPRGTLEVLDVETLRQLRDEGAELALFGSCPLTHVPEDASLPLRRLLAIAARRLSRVYDFEGVTAYKAKFCPDDWEPRYLSFSPRSSLPRVVLALGRAQSTRGLGALARRLARH
jgi:phosphatidylglycerol lysyltransferase